MTAHNNLVVVRSFSKALGLAGVRLGFVAGPEAIVNALFKVRASFDINALAIAAGEWALDHPEIIASYVQRDSRKAGDSSDGSPRSTICGRPRRTANFQLIKVGPRI